MAETHTDLQVLEMHQSHYFESYSVTLQYTVEVKKVTVVNEWRERERECKSCSPLEM